VRSGTLSKPLRFLQQLLETLAVLELDRHQLGQLVDGFVQRGQLGRRDLQREGRVVARQDHAVAVQDQAAIGHDRHHRDAVLFRLHREVLVLDDLQPDKARQQQREADEHHPAQRGDAGAELPQLLFGILDLHYASAPRSGMPVRTARLWR
jgi:hypothetical protein